MYRSPCVSYGFIAVAKGVSVNIAYTSQFQLPIAVWLHKKQAEVPFISKAVIAFDGNNNVVDILTSKQIVTIFNCYCNKDKNILKKKIG
jgi:lipoprotein signal peptidase